MTTEDVVRKFWASIESRDWEATAALLADDVVVDWPATREYWTTVGGDPRPTWREPFTELY